MQDRGRVLSRNQDRHFLERSHKTPVASYPPADCSSWYTRCESATSCDSICRRAVFHETLAPVHHHDQTTLLLYPHNSLPKLVPASHNAHSSLLRHTFHLSCCKVQRAIIQVGKTQPSEIPEGSDGFVLRLLQVCDIHRRFYRPRCNS